MISSNLCKWQKVGRVLSEQKKAYPSNDAGQSGLMNTTTETKNAGFTSDKIMHVEARTVWDERVLNRSYSEKDSGIWVDN